ncbi:MAG: DUF1295 domain-containing protein [Alphaproteobacteria bacterium]
MLYGTYIAAMIFVLAMGTYTLIMSRKGANPYGRHMYPGQKRTMNALPAWLLFESPQLFAFALTFWLVVENPSTPALVLFGLWQCHYIYRALIFPLRMKDRGKQFPIESVVFGIVFNAINGFINGYAVSIAPHLMGEGWFSDPRFIIGLVIAATGWLINFHSDSVLIHLRDDGSTGYKIPYGGVFKYVSSANYFGELVMWTGWAIMSWTLGGLVFALFTAANLGPRALAHHQWYLRKFDDYPKERKALIPFLL